MRSILMIALCAPLILILADDLTENEISLDDTNGDKIIHHFIGVDENDEEYLEHEEKLNLEELYKDSVEAYLEEDWNGCIDGFTEAIQRYEKKIAPKIAE